MYPAPAIIAVDKERASNLQLRNKLLSIRNTAVKY
jgi:hypothetical protein